MIGDKAQVIKWLLDQKDGDYEAKPYRHKRTLTQNAYFHVLVGQIAKAVGNKTDTEVKNQLIADYGVIDIDTGVVIMDDAVPWDKSPYLHLRPTTATRTLDDGKLYRVYHVMKGSRMLDTAEMAHLLDGTIREAQELGIETLPPHILASLRR